MLTVFLFILSAIGAVIGAALPLMGGSHFVHNQIMLLCIAIAGIAFLGLLVLSTLITLPWWVIAFGPCAAALTTHAWIWISLR